MNNKRFASLSALFVLVALAISAMAQNTEEQLKKYETDRAAAVVKGDVDTVEKGTADDYTFINANGQQMDKSQLVNAMKTGGLKLTADDISDMRVRVYGDTAVITGKSNVKGTIGGKDASGLQLFTRVVVKKDGRWQSIALQQTKAEE